MPGRTQSGFTLVEIMIVISIMAIVMAVGVPTTLRALQKDSLKKAVNDVVEGCSHARAQAILQGVPSEFYLRAEDGKMAVRQVRSPVAREALATVEKGAPAHIFQASLNEEVAVELIDVNFVDMMQASQAVVRFHPNGTSDEFTVILTSTEGSYKVSTDVVTGLTDVEQIR